MKTAYLYVRVSTDEQEERLPKYCRYKNIEVKGIYREDFSAKNFNRPEWKKLFLEVKSKPKQDKNILFIKWDRFSRNVEYAYEMIGMLRKYKTTVLAIDQPIDFSVPESTVMLAVCLSVPEAKNSKTGNEHSKRYPSCKTDGQISEQSSFGFYQSDDGRWQENHYTKPTRGRHNKMGLSPTCQEYP